MLKTSVEDSSLSYRNDYSRSQHVVTVGVSPLPPPSPRRPHSPMTPEQERFSAFTNRFSAHDPTLSPIRRNPNHHQPPTPNYHAVSVSERIKRFSDQGGYTQQQQQQQQQQLSGPGKPLTQQQTPLLPESSITPTSSSSSTEQRQPRAVRTKSSLPQSLHHMALPLSPPPPSSFRKTNEITDYGPPRRLRILDPPATNLDPPASNSSTVTIETPNASTVHELKSKLWDDEEQLQVAVKPSLQYHSRQTMSHSVSPGKPQPIYKHATINNQQPVFKSKFYEAAVAARKTKSFPLRTEPRAPLTRADLPNVPPTISSPPQLVQPYQQMQVKQPTQLQPPTPTLEPQIRWKQEDSTQPVELEQNDSGTVESKSVSMLVARLNAVSRTDPAKALAQIDFILKNESKSSSEPDPPLVNKEIDLADHDDNSSESSSDDETSVSAITDPTYVSSRSALSPEDVNLGSYHRLRPNSLPSYNVVQPVMEELKSDQKKKDKQDRRASPPTTINVNPTKNSVDRDMNKLDLHLNKPIDHNTAAVIALKIRMWDEMSQPRQEGEDGATAVTEELGSIMTPAFSAGEAPQKISSAKSSETPVLLPSLSASESRDSESLPRRKHPWDSHHPKHKWSTPMLVETSMDGGVGLEIRPQSPVEYRPTLRIPNFLHQDHSDVAPSGQQLITPSSREPPALLDRKISQLASTNFLNELTTPPQSTGSREIGINLGFSGDNFDVDPKLLDDSFSTTKTTPKACSNFVAADWVDLPPSTFFHAPQIPATSARLSTIPQQQGQTMEHSVQQSNPPQRSQPDRVPRRQPEPQLKRQIITASKSFDMHPVSSAPPPIERSLTNTSDSGEQALKSPARRFRLALLKRRSTAASPSPDNLPISPQYKQVASTDEVESSSGISRRTFSRSPGRFRTRSEPGNTNSSRNSTFTKKLSRLMRVHDKDLF